MADEDGVTPYYLAMQRENDFAVGLFLPKLTFGEIVRWLRKYRDDVGENPRMSLVIAEKCQDVVKVSALQAFVDIVYAYLGFDIVKPVRMHREEKRREGENKAQQAKASSKAVVPHLMCLEREIAKEVELRTNGQKYQHRALKNAETLIKTQRDSIFYEKERVLYYEPPF